MDKRTYTFERVNLYSESHKAWHCSIGDSMFWVPKSQTVSFDYRSGHLVTSTWWAEVSGAQNAYESWRPASADDSLNSAAAVYRRLALKYHPDRNPGSSEVMRDLNEFWQAVKADLQNSNGQGKRR